MKLKPEISFCARSTFMFHFVILSFPQDAPVKLCDFGFAKIDQGDLMTPQFTPYYVAPQVKSIEHIEVIQKYVF